MKVYIHSNYDFIVKTARHELNGYLNQYYEDLAHSCILKLLENTGSFEGNSKQFRAFIRRVIKNAATDLYRQTGRIKGKGFMSIPDDYTPDKISMERTPEELIVAQENRKIVRTCLLKLCKRDRQIILMRDYFDSTNEQIAIRLGITARNVSMYYTRASRRLTELVKKESGEFVPRFLFSHLS